MPMRQPPDTTYSQVLDPTTSAPSDKVIKRDSDGAFIPFDDANTDYQEYKAWLEAGNKPKEPARGRDDN